MNEQMMSDADVEQSRGIVAVSPDRAEVALHAGRLAHHFAARAAHYARCRAYTKRVRAEAEAAKFAAMCGE